MTALVDQQLNIHVTFDIKGEMVNTCKDPVKAAKNIATHAMMTMGKHLNFCQVKVNDGCIAIDHTFAAAKESYEDEFNLFSDKHPMTHEMTLAGLNYVEKGQCQLSDHVILWLYRVREEGEKSEKRRIDALSKDATRRTYFIGSVALNTVELLKCSLDPKANKVFQIRHNYTSTHVTCTVRDAPVGTREKVSKNIALLEGLTDAYNALQNDLTTFDISKDIRKAVIDPGPAADQRTTFQHGFDFIDEMDESRILSILTPADLNTRMVKVSALKKFSFRPSPLRHLAEINELVQLEQVKLHLELPHNSQIGCIWHCECIVCDMCIIVRHFYFLTLQTIKYCRVYYRL